jgi:hypothetical protein
VNVIEIHSGAHELIAVGGPEIEDEPTAWPQEPPVNGVRRVTDLRERIDQFFADVVTTGTDARSDCDNQIRRRRPACGKRPDRGAGDASRCAPPSGMHGRYEAGTGIGHEQRHAVRDPHRDGSRRVSRDDCVGFREPASGIQRVIRVMDSSSMHLPRHRQPGAIDTNGPGYLVPAIHPAAARLKRPERQVSGGEEMVRHCRKRRRAQRSPPWLLRPDERLVSL